jgi:hypothetical protein
MALIMKRASQIWLMGPFLAFTLAPAWAAVDEPLHLEVTEHTDVAHEFAGTAKSYGVIITNRIDSAVTIERGIWIEKETSSGWVKQAGIQAVANCGDFDYGYNWKAQIRLDAHSTPAVVPWDDFTWAMHGIVLAQHHARFGYLPLCGGNRPSHAKDR